MKKKVKSFFYQQGFSFIEIIIYGLLLSVLLLVVASFLWQILDFKIANQNQSDLIQNVNLISEKLNNDFKNCTKVIMPADATFASNLVFEVNEATITYQIIEGRLKRDNLNLTDQKIIVNSIGEEKGFRRIGDTIQIALDLETKLKPKGRSGKVFLFKTSLALENQ